LKFQTGLVPRAIGLGLKKPDALAQTHQLPCLIDQIRIFSYHYRFGATIICTLKRNLGFFSRRYPRAVARFSEKQSSLKGSKK
jgi:hypothetical protein